MTDFFKFPHTAHIAWLSNGVPRDDKLMSPPEVEILLAGEVVVEEKIDGANIGISIDDSNSWRVQNRGQYLDAPYTGQFSRLNSWLMQHEDAFHRSLNANTILFGEWCAAVHSIQYDTLPDWFLLFDVYDRKEGKFWSVRRRNALAAGIGLTVVPELFRGSASIPDIVRMLSTQLSRFADTPLEGIFVRRDSEEWCLARGKLVRMDFVQAIVEHWKRGGLRWNRLERT